MRSLAQMRANLQSREETTVDARSAGRFAGREPEPRPGLRGGHIPGSLNLPFDQVYLICELPGGYFARTGAPFAAGLFICTNLLAW